ncbi:MAG: tetratricopeptide repeat protein [Rikenellaceae bacterium]|nr:tetratricopeptide repeat protein [Rikenellaceae bacterium]
MEQNKKQTNEEPQEVIGNALSSAEIFLRDHSKIFFGIIGAAVIIVAGIFCYKNFVVQPKQEEASAQMYVAEQLFAVEKFEEALNGDGNNLGFLDIIKKYGSTPQGNLANRYAGICYMKLGQWNEAIKFLNQYKFKKGVPNEVLNAMNYGLLGDCYVQLNDYKNAKNFYTQAVNYSNNMLTTPMYLKKLGMILEQLNENTAALEVYKRIKYEFMNSIEARDVNKYIGRLEQK